MLGLCFLLQYVVAFSEEWSYDRASGIDVGMRSGAKTSEVFGQVDDLFMLQLNSYQKHAAEKAWADPVEWQCHLYSHGQGDKWCKTTAIQGSFEYSFNGGKFNQCGGCWCCKREIPMAEHAWLLAIAKDVPLTKELQTELTDNTPAWSCHTYSHGQNDDWCKKSTIEGRYSYSFNDGKFDQCGGCFCCRREIPKSDLVRVLAESEELSLPAKGVLAELSGDNIAWECHQYEKGQTDEWCSKTAIEGGYEISYNGGEFNQCGGCHCCERKIPLVQRAQLLIGSGQDLHEAGGSRAVPPGLDPSEVVPTSQDNADASALAWQCHLYAKGQNDAWCSKATIVDGIEYSFTGGRFDQCGGCYCCRREIPKYQIANFFTVEVNALLQSDNPPETATVEFHDEESSEYGQWQCHKYAPGQTDDWCKSKIFEGGYEYSYNSGECGDCFCCKREAKQPDLLALAQDVHLTADLQMKLDEGAPAWSCHKYTQGQTDSWCKTTMFEDGISYSYTGGKFDQCGGCWCCKREIPETALARVLAEADEEFPLAGAVQLNQESAAWHCHKYKEGQSDAWCITATIEDGYEFSFNAGNFDQCGGCFCCRREIPKKQRAQLLIAGKELASATHDTDEPTQPWQRHDYAPGQSDDWCRKATVVGDFQYSFNGGMFDQCGGSYCCKRQIPKYQIASFFTVRASLLQSTLKEQQSPSVVTSPTSILYEFPEPNAWRCHQYEQGQTDAWCKKATIEAGWEYSYNNGEPNQCGGCFCCKREVPQAQEASLRVAAKGLSFTAELQTQLSEDAPAWTCHQYENGQNDGWCRRGQDGWVRIDNGFSYSYTGGKFNQCGGCFCCKRQVPDTALVRIIAQASHLSVFRQLELNDEASTWQCHKYTKGQTDAWCQSTTIAEGHEFSYNGGNFDQCGGCFCCSRAIPKIQQAQLLIAGEALPRTPESFGDEPTPVWQCHEYSKGQSDDWCSRATIVDGYQYSFNGGEFHQCGGCYCCKREIPNSQLVRFFNS